MIRYISLLKARRVHLHRNYLTLLPLLWLLPLYPVAQEADAEAVVAEFEKRAEALQKVSYRANRIDTFVNGGAVWNRYGDVIIEKDTADATFGYSFYAYQDDFPIKFLYDKGYCFSINEKKKEYELEGAYQGFLGSPGGQLVLQSIFALDTAFQTRGLTETDTTYVLRYTYKDDTVYSVADREKIIRLDKSTFFPLEVQTSYRNTLADTRGVHRILVKSYQLNEEAKGSIAQQKAALKDYQVTREEAPSENELLDKPFPPIELPKLADSTQTFTLETGKHVLLDFWEIWCGPCLKALPKVETLSKKHGDKIQVVGIVSESPPLALKLVREKKVSFLNLIGNKTLLQQYGIRGIPTYVLIDKDGIVRKTYFGFSDQIEKDIDAL